MLEKKQDKRILTAGQAKALDKMAVEKFGIPVLLLMENAGSAVSIEALKVLRDHPGKIAVFCGKGNNGGDGFCAARHLLAAGIRPDVYLAGKISDIKDEAGVNLNILLQLRQKITQVSPEKLHFIKTKAKKYSLIIDALLGVGARGKLRQVYQELVNIINASKAYVLSVDIPSGLDAASGKLPGACIKADKTITFVGKKRGMTSGKGKSHCGKILVKNIGVPL
ncbi:MAG: NAD(P)H-hydrate epimerase [Candidatus Omnitrophica bacterium]|nr:NAD(P)H-hydrate epimerase [Candidatus Omnitrophota bacterium]